MITSDDFKLMSGRRSLVRMSGSATAQSVVFLPGMMGEPVYAKKLLSGFPDLLPVVGLRYPASALECEPSTMIAVLADFFAETLVGEAFESPILTGYSYSGILAFETARALWRRGLPAGSLIIIDAPVPFTLRRKRLHQHLMFSLITAKQRVLGDFGDPGPLYLNELWKPDFASYPDSLQPTLRASYAAMCEYRPGEYEGDITVVRSTNSRRIYWGDRYQGWQQFTKGDVVEVKVKGEHARLLDNPVNQQIITDTILEARARSRHQHDY